MNKYLTAIVASSLAGLLALLTSPPVARADIFKWEYINPANPSLGKQLSTMLAPDGAGAVTEPGADLSNRNLTMAYLIGDLQDANLSQANLTNATVLAGLIGANLAGAEVRGVHFQTAISIAQLYSTGSYQAHDLTGIILGFLDLTGMNLSSQNLTDGNFSNASMAGASLSQANAARANFNRVILSDADLSYGNFTGASFATVWVDYFNGTDLSGANLSHANLTNVDFRGSTKVDFEGGLTYFPGAYLIGANLSGADARGANFFLANLTGATTTNLIQANGHIAGLDLTGGASLVIRDYDGNPAATPTTGPMPIVVDEHLAMDAGGTLQLVFDADAWDSTTSFAPDIPVALGGTLELSFAPGVELASQFGRILDLFDWTGVSPSGSFAISSPYAWNLSKLYTTGEVTLTSALAGDMNLDGAVNIFDVNTVSAYWGTAGPAGDANGDGIVNIFDVNLISAHWTPTGGATQVPEPSSLALFAGAMVFAAFGGCTRVGTRRARAPQRSS